VDDDSGANALVLVEDANFMLKREDRKIVIQADNFDKMPSHLREALTVHQDELENFKLKDTSWVFPKVYRFLEWYFLEEELYVLGYSESAVGAPQRNNAELETQYSAEKLAELSKKTKMIFRKKKAHPFHISNRKEKDMLPLFRIPGLLIWAGAASWIGGTVYIINLFF